MGKPKPPISRIEPLPLPDGGGLLGEIFESAIFHDMRHAAEGELNRHYVARAVVLVLKVNGQAEYGDETGRVVPLVPGSCFLVDPKIGHRYGPVKGSLWTEMYLSFRGPIFETLELSSYLMAEPVRHLSPLPAWRKKLRSVLPAAGENSSPDACNGRLIAFLTEAFLPAPAARNESDAWIPIAKQILGTENVTIAEAMERLSDTVGLSPETLRKRFRVVTGSSMKAWQMAGRVATARALLTRGNMTQKEIAAALGFSNPQHFSRCMRKATGTAPGNLQNNGKLPLMPGA